jgi:P-type Ca2+ transporter type 2C
LSLTPSPYDLANFFEEVVVQVLICFVGGMAFQVTRMGGKEWAISLALGFISLPLGALIRCIPNEPCEHLFVKLRMLPKQEVLPTTHPDAQPGMSFAMDQVRDNLGTFAKLRGGRMRASSFVRTSRSAGPNNPDAPRLV